MPTQAEYGSIGGRLAAERMSPAQRTERARKAHLVSSVNAVVNRAPELTPEQIDRLRAILGGVAR